MQADFGIFSDVIFYGFLSDFEDLAKISATNTHSDEIVESRFSLTICKWKKMGCFRGLLSERSENQIKIAEN